MSILVKQNKRLFNTDGNNMMYLQLTSVTLETFMDRAEVYEMVNEAEKFMLFMLESDSIK